MRLEKGRRNRFKVLQTFRGSVGAPSNMDSFQRLRNVVSER